jgi:hypothetical protein
MLEIKIEEKMDLSRVACQMEKFPSRVDVSENPQRKAVPCGR